jgi:hypothetical protein
MDILRFLQVQARERVDTQILRRAEENIRILMNP